MRIWRKISETKIMSLIQEIETTPCTVFIKCLVEDANTLHYQIISNKTETETKTTGGMDHVLWAFPINKWGFVCTVFQYTVVDTLAIALKLLLQLECTFMSIAIIRKWQKFKYRKSSNKHPGRLF